MKFLLAVVIALFSYSLMAKVRSGGGLNILKSQAVAANNAGSGATANQKRYYNELSCEERVIVIAPFEQFSEGSFGGIAFSCAVARYLDKDDLTKEQKFKHLTEQAERSGKWRAALFKWMARLDWPRFEQYILSQNKKFRAKEWIAICQGWNDWSKGQTSTVPMRKLLFDRALHDKNEEVRYWTTGYVVSTRLSPQGVTLDEAMALTKRLPLESNPDIIESIIDAQLWNDDPRANRIVRKFLRGPTRAMIVESVITDSHYVDLNRYDFLPEIYALRDFQVKEKKVRKTDEASKTLKRINEIISTLEEKKRQNAPIGKMALPQ